LPSAHYVLLLAIDRLIVVDSPAAARPLLGTTPEAFAREPLLGDHELW